MSQPDPTFDAVFSIGPCYESLFESFTHRELRTLQPDVGNRELPTSVGNRRRKEAIRSDRFFLQRYPIWEADVDAGEQVALLHRHAAIPSDARLELQRVHLAELRRRTTRSTSRRRCRRHRVAAAEAWPAEIDGSEGDSCATMVLTTTPRRAPRAAWRRG